MARSVILKSIVIMAIGFYCAGFSSMGFGSAARDVSFDEPSSIAIGLFNQGYRHCQAAHRQRSRDIKGAQRKFQRYLDYLAQAKAEDIRVVSSSVNNIDRNIVYCNQVAEDLTRVVATPYLEKSYDSCKTARQFLTDFDVINAEKYFKAHVQLKSKALHMSADILSIAPSQTWIHEGERLCKRVKLNIKRLGNRLARINLDLPVVQEHLDFAVRQCRAARKGMNEDVAVTEVERLLKGVQRAIGQAKEYETVWTYQQAKKENAGQSKLLSSLASSNWCEYQLSKEIADLIENNQVQALFAEREALRLKRLASQQLLELKSKNVKGPLIDGKSAALNSPLMVSYQPEVGIYPELEFAVDFEDRGKEFEGLWGGWMGFEAVERSGFFHFEASTGAIPDDPEGLTKEKREGVGVGVGVGDLEVAEGEAALEMSQLGRLKPVSEWGSANSNAMARRAPVLNSRH